jgi:hypothetical protein
MTTPALWNESRYALKLGGESAEVTELSLAEWPEPFQTSYETDAHFWPYVIFVDGKVSDLQIPVRVTNGRPSKIAPNEAVLLQYVVLEYDDHDSETGMPPDEREAFVELLELLPADSPLRRWAAFYWTKGGARLVYRLTHAISFERYSRYWRALAAELAEHTGIECDATGLEWWRCYRLPKVRRDGVPSQHHDWFMLDLTENLLETDSVAPRVQPVPWERTAASAPAAGPSPAAKIEPLTPEVSKLVRTALKSTAAFAYVYEGAQPPQGERDRIISLVAGITVGKLFGRHPTITPENIYQLLLPMVEDIDTEGEVLTSKLWRLVSLSWNAELERAREQEHEAIVAKTREEELAIAVVRCWPPEARPGKDEDQVAWAMKRLLLARRNGLVPFNGTHYSPSVLTPGQVPSHLRDLIPFADGLYTSTGALRGAASLIGDFATNIQEMAFVMGPKRGVTVALHRGEPRIEIVPHQIDQRLMAAAEHSQEVDSYLRSYGRDNYRRLVSWLSACPALQKGPIAALSLRGPRGAGKSMLALAVSEIFGGWVGGATAFSKHNEGLLESPVIVLDEGLPQKVEGVAVPDAFRTMQSGMPWHIDPKFLPVTPATINWRFMMTSNGNDVIRSLAGNSSLQREDTEALMQRIVHLEVPPHASAFLAAAGGRGFTKEWIEGDALLPRHILWLYRTALENNAFVTSQRFLVEGEEDMLLMALMEGGGAAPEVAQLICKDVDAWMTGRANTIQHLRVETEKEGLVGVWIRKLDWTRAAAERLGRGFKSIDIRRVIERWTTGKDFKFNGAVHTQIRLKEVENIARVENIDHDNLLRLIEKSARAVATA